MRSGLMARAVVVLALVALSVPAAAMAQTGTYYHRGTFMIGGGVNSPVGESNPYLNSSGTFFFGGGRNVNQKLGIQVEYTHNWLSIDPSVIDHALADGDSITGSHASLWSVTLNGVWRFGPGNDFVPWVTGGAGYYKRNLQFTQTALVYYPPIWDPWWGWVDGGWGPGEAIVGERTGRRVRVQRGLRSGHVDRGRHLAVRRSALSPSLPARRGPPDHPDQRRDSLVEASRSAVLAGEPMSSRRLIWVGALVGGAVGGFLPGLWHASPLSMSGLLFSTIGGLAGIWAGWKIGSS